MKFLIHANAPQSSTGYGVQCALLADRLKAAGHDVAISATWGQQGFVGMWHGMPVFPQGYLVNSDDVITAHAAAFFGDEPGWIIPLQDLWCLKNPELAAFNVAAWCPVDHLPVPPAVLEFFTRNPDAIPVAMSRWGEKYLLEAGLDPAYIPLSVDTSVFKPTPFVDLGDRRIDARDLIGVDKRAFCIGMVAMNKGWSKDRKGFWEALAAFGKFWRRHNNAVLYLHTEIAGTLEGMPLLDMARHAGIPPEAIAVANQYAYRTGMTPEMMAATYTAMDVLLSPSHGEGFCVPLIEAQACGVPVIASKFSAQIELAGPEYGAAGWLIDGQLEYDPSQRALYMTPYIDHIVELLEEAYAADLVELQGPARQFAMQYDADKVFADHWLPFIERLKPQPVVEREPMTTVDVIVPCLRAVNETRLVGSFDSTNDGTALLHIVERGDPTRTYAENVNVGVKSTEGSFVCIVGDDVEFTPGWIEAAREASTRGDVIGTNDSEPGRTRNPDVAAGRHADHFLIRRTYIETQGASLEGPGVLASETYHHWFTDKEIVELAKARRVYVHADDCRIIHHHPGYDGREDLRQSDDVYMLAVEAADVDRANWMARLPLIQMQRS
jgi:glycosyltransferase involved in cell wall biosynthesis